jgi:hypothetical protein
MPPVEALERLAAASINLIPLDLDGYYAFERDGFMALVQRRKDDAFGQVGTAGLLTESGLSPLVWRGDQPVFTSRASQDCAATPAQVEALRSFQADLQTALHG